MAVESEAITSDSSPPKPALLEYGFWCFIAIAVGRLGELIPGLASIPLAKIAIGVALIGLIANWKRLPRLAPAARPIASTARWLLILVVALTPFSIWPGASLQFLLQELPTLSAITVIGYMMCRSWRSLRGTLLALVFSGVILARAALSGYSGGRAATDTMYDTNDLAYILVTILPISIGFLLTAKSKFKRLLYGGASLVLMIAILLTQSRGGLFGLLAASALMLFGSIRPPSKAGAGVRVSRKGKLAYLVAAVCGGMLIWFQLPYEARTRFSTVLDLGNDYNLDPTNDKSRGQIWSRGLQATLSRPIGYGPNSFGMVDYRFGGRMMAPHNSFIQDLVELGVLGLFLFLRMYWLCWRTLKRARSLFLQRSALTDAEREQFVFARTLQCALVGNAVAGFFLSMAWATILWLLFATCMALIAYSESVFVESPR